MKISYAEYLRRVQGCFLGKSVGGTLGMPFEGDLSERTVTYYDPVPDAMVANDDLDLQVTNLEHVLQKGLPVSGKYLAELWTKNLNGWPDEYGVANHNAESGIFPPLSGSFNNYFHGGMGAAIRSELWACLCPGDPELAARLSRQDACGDHTDDGMDAEMFLAAVESMAFVEKDYKKMIARGLALIPQDGRLANALRDTEKWWNELGDVHAVRCALLEKYPTDNWTDVSINLSLILLSWLAGEGNFSRGICIAAGLGYDADCTCATLGSILGAMHPEEIEERWTKPIGDDLVLSCGMTGMHEPETIGEFCDRIIGIAPELLKFYGSEVEITDFPADKLVKLPKPWTAYPEQGEWDNDGRTAIVALQPVVVHLKYPQGVSVTPGVPATFGIKVMNPSQKVYNAKISLSLPDGWTAQPEANTVAVAPGAAAECTFTVTPSTWEKRRPYYNPMVINFEGDFDWQCEAGMPLTIPWKRRRLPDGAWEFVEAPNNFQELPTGKWEYVGRVKFGTGEKLANLNVQSYRHTVSKLDGEIVKDYDGSMYIPAFHRSPAAQYCSITHDWHEISITVDDGKACEMFVGFSDQRGCGKWINHAEWGKPTL